MRRPYGSGQIYEKSGAWYGRWRTADGRRVNRRLGPKRTRGESDGLTRAQAEQAFRRIQAEEASRKPVEPVVEILTVDQVVDLLRERIAIEGARKSYRENCQSMQRVHISPALGKRKVGAVTTRDVERLGELDAGRGRVAQDGAQRDDVPALGVRARGQAGLGAEQPGRGRRAAEAPTGGRR